MKRWAVGWYNLYDGNLAIEIVQAIDWKAAICQHPQAKDYEVHLMATLEEAKQAAFNCDAGLDVVEITP